jgi:hypothetical protein
MIQRIAVVIILTVMVVAGPYWLYIPLIVLAIFLYPFFIEGMFLGFLIDALYGVGDRSIFFLNFPFALVGTLLILVVPFVRSRLRFNA